MRKNKQKLELTWIGKEKRPRLEPRVLVEEKTLSYSAKEMEDSTVLDKKRAAQKWCGYANEHAVKIGANPWLYLLIPHDEILPNSSLDGLIARFSVGL